MTTLVRDDALEMIDTFLDWLDILNPVSAHIADYDENREQWVGMRGQVANFLTLFDQHDVAQVVIARGAWPDHPVVGVEARCVKCGEIFCPTNAADLIHQEASTGDCGGFGLVEGSW